VEPLIATLEDPAQEARESAIEALGAIGDAQAVEPLITALGDSNEATRSAAAEALGAIGDARAVEPLIAALQGATDRECGCVAKALTEVGSPANVSSLIQMASGGETRARARAAAGVLAKWYRSSSLSPQDKQAILKTRDELKQRHRDLTNRVHKDRHTDSGRCELHDDNWVHEHSDLGPRIEL
jgi:HEAT repeat protein